MSRGTARFGRVLAATALVLLTACGGADDSRTELVDALEAIDDSVTGSDDDLVVQRIDELVERTEAARDAGDIGDAEAEQVLAAAEALRAAVLAGAEDPTGEPTTPAAEPTTEPTTSSPTAPPSTSAPSDDEDESPPGEEREDGPGKPDKPEKPDKPDKPEKPGDDGDEDDRDG